MGGEASRASMVLITVILISGMATAQTLVVNGDFDTNVAGWTELSIPLSWDGSSDWQGNPASGSALILNNAAFADNSGAIQCVDGIVAGEVYSLSAWLRVPSGQTGTGAARVFIWYYSEPGCAGTWVGESSTPVMAASDVWIGLSSGDTVAPATAQSVKVYLNNFKYTETGIYQASYDHVAFTLIGVFADGFESGDTTEWSASVP